MRHETRVWLPPALVGLALFALAFAPSRTSEPAPRPVPDDGKRRYAAWMVLSRMMPAPFPPMFDVRVFLPERLTRQIEQRGGYR